MNTEQKHETIQLTQSLDHQTLPEARINFKSAVCCVSPENEFGVGHMSLSLPRSSCKYPWVDLGQIFYSSPTPKQCFDAETSPEFTEGKKAFSDINRRLSKKQATLIVDKINKMLIREFPNGIPPDDDINE